MNVPLAIHTLTMDKSEESLWQWASLTSHLQVLVPGVLLEVSESFLVWFGLFVRSQGSILCSCFDLTQRVPEVTHSSYVANIVVNQFQEEFRGQENNVSWFHPIQLSILTEFVNHSTILHQRSWQKVRRPLLIMVRRWTNWNSSSVRERTLIFYVS